MTNIIKTVSRILLIILIMQIIFAVGSVSRVKALSDIISEGKNFIKDRKRCAR